MIRAVNLKKIYKMGEIEVPALRGVSLDIPDGDYVAIEGPSGSGKSTLLNMIGCLDRPTSGNVFIDDVDTSKLNDNELAKIRREKIGFIFQMFNLIPTLNALENVSLPMMFYGASRGKRIKKAEELLKIVGLSDRANHKPSELSGGEQQRVAIARALANDPPVIFGDEPTGNLDTEAGKVIMDFLEKLNKKGETLIIVTHDPEIAARAHRSIRMRDGTLKA
ncbi:MAG: ABC transporter ATP-binding protein [Methanocellales archaeon]|nr:ABC transporter ATP-binding protein [Methanocellales archaeon]MDD4898069.1 ABC transporter ATP-binding protein [Methanocellales archaeon]MDD5447477.1 ABC transporter ATP-binding protein [Methanocellales archaeon]